MINPVSSYKNRNNNQLTTFGHGNNSDCTLSRKKKAVILASSIIGMSPVLAVMSKCKGFSLNPLKIFKTPLKDWALFKYTPKEKSLEFESPLSILALASGSVAGGFVGGALVDDKSNLSAKKREVLSQILGNVSVPVACVGLGASIYKKYGHIIENLMPQFKKDNRVCHVINNVMKKIPNAVTTLGLLGVGIYLGNKVSNLINEKLYHKKVERNIKVTDFAPHVDDVCLAVSMMNQETQFGAKLGKIIPLALLVPGYQTGIAQEKPENA